MQGREQGARQGQAENGEPALPESAARGRHGLLPILPSKGPKDVTKFPRAGGKHKEATSSPPRCRTWGVPGAGPLWAAYGRARWESASTMSGDVSGIGDWAPPP